MWRHAWPLVGFAWQCQYKLSVLSLSWQVIIVGDNRAHTARGRSVKGPAWEQFVLVLKLSKEFKFDFSLAGWTPAYPYLWVLEDFNLIGRFWTNTHHALSEHWNEDGICTCISHHAENTRTVGKCTPNYWIMLHHDITLIKMRVKNWPRMSKIKTSNMYLLTSKQPWWISFTKSYTSIIGKHTVSVASEYNVPSSS